MIAVDTNIVLRLILEDDERQLNLISAIMAKQRLFVSLTVMLEVGWVLASRYQMPRAMLADALAAVTMLDGVEVARVDLVRWAVDRFRAGADWADMIHVVSSSKLGGFVTFDKRLARDVGSNAPVSIEIPL